jgi:hypothetical protein
MEMIGIVALCVVVPVLTAGLFLASVELLKANF